MLCDQAVSFHCSSIPACCCTLRQTACCPHLSTLLYYYYYYYYYYYHHHYHVILRVCRAAQGKSTLVNRLLGEERCLTGVIPHKCDSPHECAQSCGCCLVPALDRT